MSDGSDGKPRFLFIRCDEDSDHGCRNSDRNSIGSTASEVETSESPSSTSGASDGTLEKDVSQFLHRLSGKRNAENRPSQSETVGYKKNKTRDSFTEVDLASTSRSCEITNNEPCIYCDTFQHERQYFLWRSQYTRSSFCAKCSEKRQFISYWGRPSYENGSWRKRLKEGRNVDIDLTPLIEVLQKIDSIDTGMGRLAYNAVGSSNAHFTPVQQQTHTKDTPYAIIHNKQETLYMSTNKVNWTNGDDKDTNFRDALIHGEPRYTKCTDEKNNVFTSENNSKTVDTNGPATPTGIAQNGGLMTSLQAQEVLSKTDVNINNTRRLIESYFAQKNGQYNTSSEIDADQIIKSKRDYSQLEWDHKKNKSIEINSNNNRRAENSHIHSVHKDSVQNDVQTENNARVNQLIAKFESESGSRVVKYYTTFNSHSSSDKYSSADDSRERQTKHVYGLRKNDHTKEKTHFINTEYSNRKKLANKDGDEGTSAHSVDCLKKIRYSTTKKAIKDAEHFNYQEHHLKETKPIDTKLNECQNSTELNQNMKWKSTADESGKTSVSRQGSYIQRYQQKRRLSRSQRDRRSSLQKIRLAQECEDDEFLKIQQKINMLGRFSKKKPVEIQNQEMAPTIQIPKTIWNKSIRNAIYGVSCKHQFKESQTGNDSISNRSSNEIECRTIKTSSHPTSEVKYIHTSGKENSHDKISLTSKTPYMTTTLRQIPDTKYRRNNTCETENSDLYQSDESKSTKLSCETMNAGIAKPNNSWDVNFHCNKSGLENQKNSKDRVLVKHGEENDQDESCVVLDSNDKESHKLNWRSRGYSCDFFMSRQSRTGAEIIEQIQHAKSNKSSRTTTPTSSSASSRKSSTSGRSYSRFTRSAPCSKRGSKRRIFSKLNSLEEASNLTMSGEEHSENHPTTSDQLKLRNSVATSTGISVEQLKAALEIAAHCTSRLDLRLEEQLK